MNKKRLCCFYLNDVHLITMLLPYINERIDQDTKIVTIFEKDISESSKKVISNVHLKNTEKLLSIDWKNKKFNEMCKLNIENSLILIYGSDEFIESANKILISKKENFDVLNCYELVQGSKNLYEILDRHDMVVNTCGENLPDKIFTEYTQKKYRKITL